MNSTDLYTNTDHWSGTATLRYVSTYIKCHCDIYLGRYVYDYTSQCPGGKTFQNLNKMLTRSK